MAILLMPHQDEWANKFLALKVNVMALVGTCIQQLEHFGSTSISGIAAKPIIDMAGTVVSLDSLDKVLEGPLPSHIENLGENGVVGRRYLVVRDSWGETQAHVHLFEDNHPEYVDRILFRNYLRLNLDTAREYETLKKNLAGRFKDDPLAYWQGKAVFIETTLLRARGT